MELNKYCVTLVFKIIYFKFDRLVCPLAILVLQSFPRKNVKTKTWRSYWYHKQKKVMRNLLLMSYNMAAKTSHAPEEYD
jgi:ABC-type spermidine/putrescine transport system permease subunit II